MGRNKLLLINLLVFTLIAFHSCKKNPADCFRSTGNQKTETRTLDTFTNLIISDNIDVELYHSPHNPYIIISAGKNLLPGIVSSIGNNTLRLNNNHSCNWVRSYDQPITIKLYYQQLDSIEFRGSGILSCADTLSADSLYLSVKEGGGTVRLLLNTKKSFINHEYGTADVHLLGLSEVNYIYQASFGPVLADSLRTKFNYLENLSTNQCRVHAEIELGVTISGQGDVFYAGNPSINLIKTGSGNLIRIEQ